MLVAPKSLEGEAQSLVFTAIHRDRNAVLYWHIDDNYIGATTLEHKISVRPAPGAHRLTVIDEHGGGQKPVFPEEGFPEWEFLGERGFSGVLVLAFPDCLPFSEFFFRARACFGSSRRVCTSADGNGRAGCYCGDRLGMDRGRLRI